MHDIKKRLVRFFVGDAFLKNLIFLFDLCLTCLFIICIAILWRGHLYIDYEIKIIKLIHLRDMYKWIYIIAPLFVWRLRVRISLLKKRDVTLYHILAQMAIVKYIKIFLYIFVHLCLFYIFIKLYADFKYWAVKMEDLEFEYATTVFYVKRAKLETLELFKLLQHLKYLEALDREISVHLYVASHRFFFFFCVLIWRVLKFIELYLEYIINKYKYQYPRIKSFLVILLILYTCFLNVICLWMYLSI
jgi:hypothetical protein